MIGNGDRNSRADRDIRPCRAQSDKEHHCHRTDDPRYVRKECRPCAKEQKPDDYAREESGGLLQHTDSQRPSDDSNSQ
jgi:hypothetical protein